MRILFQLILLLVTSTLLAQPVPEPDLSKFKTQSEKVKAWIDFCDKMLVTEDYNRLRNLGKKGLKLVLKDDYKRQSLFNFYIGVAFNAGNQPDSAIYYFSKSEKLARRAKHKIRIYEALKQLLHASDSYGKDATRVRALDSLLRIVDTTKSEEIKSEIYQNISSYYTDKGQYETGLRYRIIGLNQRRKTLHKATADDSINFGVQLLNVGEIYMELKQPRKGLDYIIESEPYLRDYDAALATVYKDYCDIYLKTGQPDKAKKYYRTLTEYLKPLKEVNCWSVLITCDLVFSDYFLEKRDIPQAMQYLNHARALLPRYGNEFSKAEVDYMAGEIYFVQKDYARALQYLNAAEPVLKESSETVYVALQKTLSEANAAVGNYKKAYRHAVLYAKIQDTLMGEAAKKNLAEMEARYQNKDKQQKINALSAENTIKNLQIENAERQRSFFIIGLALSLGIIASLAIIYRNNKRNSRLLEQKNAEMQKLNASLGKANQTKAKLFSIISHDMRTPISQISQFLDLQQSDPGLFSEEDKARHNRRISGSAEALLETMEDLLIWSKAQMQQFSVSNEKINLHEWVEGLRNLLSVQLQRKRLDFINAIDPGLQLTTDRNMVTIIFRNLLQNAIAHAPDGSGITLTAEKSGEKTNLKIADQGSGMPESVKALFNGSALPVGSGKSGLGLTIVREMAEMLGAEIWILDNVPNGTVFVVSVSDEN